VPGFTTAHATLSVGQVMAVISPDYLLHSYIQELAARGIMQNTMQRFLRDEHGVRSIMVLSLAFGVMHTHLGLTMVLSSTVASVCFGFFYRRHRNLIGVTIVHYITGVAGRYLTMIVSI
jgi:membrane protease YdiL (CAAX protease family)